MTDQNGGVVTLQIGSRLTMTGGGDELEAMVSKWLTLPNPLYVNGLKQGRWVKNIPPKLYYYEKKKNCLIMPRGYLDRLIEDVRSVGKQLLLIDNRSLLPPIQLPFSGRLRDLQVTAVQQMLQRTQGFLKAGTGSGKTVMALYLISRRQQPALIIVPNKTLMYQWLDQVAVFLSLPKEEVGMLGDGQDTIGKEITIGIVNTVSRKAPELKGLFGHVVVDEAHRAVSSTYQNALKEIDACFLLALSATPFRRDGLTRLLFITLGDVVAEIENQDLVEAGHLVNAETQWIRTDFFTETNASDDYSKVIDELTHNSERNLLICRTIAGNHPIRRSLILSDRKEHCHTLKALLQSTADIDSRVLVGGLPKARIESALHDIASGKCHILIGTTQLLGEGFDLPALEALYLTVPLRFRGRLIQNIGRILRASRDKETAMIYDFADHKVGVLRASALARVQAYKSAGIKNLKAL